MEQPGVKSVAQGYNGDNSCSAIGLDALTTMTQNKMKMYLHGT